MTVLCPSPRGQDAAADCERPRYENQVTVPCSLFPGRAKEPGDPHCPHDIKLKALLPFWRSPLLRLLLSLHFRYQACFPTAWISWLRWCVPRPVDCTSCSSAQQRTVLWESFIFHATLCHEGYFSAAGQKERACRKVRPAYFFIWLKNYFSRIPAFFWQEIFEKPLGSPALLSAPTHGGMPEETVSWSILERD